MDKLFNYKLKPMKHQEKAYDLSEDKEYFAYLCDMGTGKTKMFLDDCANLVTKGKIQACVVIAPKGVYRNWENVEIPKHFTDDIDKVILTWDSNNRTKNREILLEDFLKPCAMFKFFIINKEALSASKRAVEYLTKFVMSNKCVVTIDESTCIKHRDSKVTKNIIGLRKHIPYRRIMTGSPITNSPLDLYSQFDFLGRSLLGFGSYFAFRSFVAYMQEINMGVRTFKQVVGYNETNLKRVQETIKSFSFRVTKEDCLDLPPKIYYSREIEMGPEQERAYREMKKLLMVTLPNKDFPVSMVTTVLTQLMKLHQIACGFIIDQDGNPIDIPGDNPRMNELMSILDECDSAIIWCNYRYNVEQVYRKLCEVYGKDKVAHYYGGTSDEDRAKAVEGFQSGKIRYFVANPSTAGYGLTLTNTHNVIYYSNGYEIDKRQQSEDRAHRIGQTNSVNYTDIIMNKSLDSKIIKSLHTKAHLQDVVLKDGWKSLLED